MLYLRWVGQVISLTQHLLREMSAYELYLPPQISVTQEHHPYSTPRRKELDHARYMSHREERLEKQREYYKENKERILAWHRNRRIKM